MGRFTEWLWCHGAYPLGVHTEISRQGPLVLCAFRLYKVTEPKKKRRRRTKWQPPRHPDGTIRCTWSVAPGEPSEFEREQRGRNLRKAFALYRGLKVAAELAGVPFKDYLLQLKEEARR